MKRLRERVESGASLHHAYHVSGDQAICEAAVLAFISGDLGVAVHGNPDVLILRYVSLAVADARQFKEFASTKPLRGAHYFVLSFQFASTEAQNALLKLLEEPMPGTYFFIITPAVGTLLPTVRSRVERLQITDVSGVHASEHIVAADFLRSTPKDRLGMVKPIIEAKDKEQLLALVGALEVYAQAAVEGGRAAEWKEGMESLLAARRYLHGKSASVKMISEYLTAVLPKA